MRKLKMSMVLPLVHCVAYIILFKWHLFPYQEPTVSIRLWFALNAPVLVLLDLAKWTATIPWVSRHIVAGVGPIYFIFFVGGATLWYFTGHALDGKRLPKAPRKIPPSVAGLVNLFVLACGIRLTFSAVHYLLPAYRGEQVSLERTAEGVVILLWSLFLMMFPLAKLVSILRHRPVSASVTNGA